MSSTPFIVFQNESDVFEIGGFTVENRLDRISIYGSLDITKDQEGLRKAMLLKPIIDGAIAEMQRKGEYLPEKIGTEQAEEVKNPFL